MSELFFYIYLAGFAIGSIYVAYSWWHDTWHIRRFREHQEEYGFAFFLMIVWPMTFIIFAPIYFFEGLEKFRKWVQKEK